MRKTLFTGLAGLSLLICIATIVLWVRSYRAADSYQNPLFNQFDIHDPNLHQQILFIRSNRGAIHIWTWRWGAIPNGWMIAKNYIPGGELLFDFSREPGGFSLHCPHWLVALIASIPPLFWFLRFRHRRRIVREGLCPQCGYDLRASTDRCPECGTAILLSPSPAGSQSRQGDRGPG